MIDYPLPSAVLTIHCRWSLWPLRMGIGTGVEVWIWTWVCNLLRRPLTVCKINNAPSGVGDVMCCWGTISARAMRCCVIKFRARVSASVCDESVKASR